MFVILMTHLYCPLVCGTVMRYLHLSLLISGTMALVVFMLFIIFVSKNNLFVILVDRSCYRLRLILSKFLCGRCKIIAIGLRSREFGYQPNQIQLKHNANL